jgi:hypothetical protein
MTVRCHAPERRQSGSSIARLDPCAKSSYPFVQRTARWHGRAGEQEGDEGMTAVLSFAATGVLITLGVWVTGGLVLRIGGAMLIADGLLRTAVTGSPSSALLSTVGAIAWLAGHWLFAVRHHYCVSPLARRVFLETLPRQLDPTRPWGIRTVPPHER